MSGIIEDGRVYRIFGHEIEFCRFLNGRWRGKGIHGLPDFSSDFISCIALKNKKDSISLKLYGKKKSALVFIPKETQKFPEIDLVLKYSDWNVGADIASLKNENNQIEIHAMNEDELYFLMEQLHPQRRILFAGTLEKTKFR
ncbi:MAG: hypothetical protein OEZ34_06825 [Spirochaetia bacterium]|nr:hypothetical protein [Spirochaetia bacterium]